jgi:hypothetical protein
MASDLALTLVKNFKAIPVSAKTFQQSFTANHAVKEGVHSLCVDHAISWRLGSSPFTFQFGAIDRIWQGFERTSDPQLNQFKQAAKSIDCFISEV